MKKQLCNVLLISGLLTITPAHAAGLPVIDTISNALEGISASIDEAMQEVTTAWQEVMESNAVKQLKTLGDSLTKLQEQFDQAQSLFDQGKALISDPTGSVISAVGLDQKKTEQLQYLPEYYTDEQLKTFEGGSGNNTITGFANDTLEQITEKPDTFTLTSSPDGKFEKAFPNKDRDAREAAYYLAMSEESYRQASQRYDGISKDYKTKIENAHDPKDKENLQMNLQAEQLMLQSQLIQLTALKQTHEARKEVADQRKQQLQKNKKDMKHISLF